MFMRIRVDTFILVIGDFQGPGDCYAGRKRGGVRVALRGGLALRRHQDRGRAHVYRGKLIQYL